MGRTSTFSNETSVTGPYCESNLIWYHKCPVTAGNYLNITVGMNNPSLHNFDLLLYPNLNCGSFTIQLPQMLASPATIHIFNSLGEEVYSDQMNTSENRKDFRLDFFKPGNLYVLSYL